MREHRTRQLLRECADEVVPREYDAWPAIRARIASAGPARRESGRRPRLRPGAALLVLIALFGTAAAINAPVLEEIFEWHPLLKRLRHEHLYHEIALRQTLNGYTVTLHGATADASNITIVYSVALPPGMPSSGGQPTDGRLLTLHEPLLTDGRGTVYRPIPGRTGSGSGSVETQVISFDASGVRGTPADLDLHLELTLALFEHVPFVDPPGATPPPGRPPSRPHWAPVAPPFAFDFRVPFAPGRIVEVGQSAASAGTTMTLQRVVVAPSLVRALICFQPPAGAGRGWALVADIDGVPAGAAGDVDLDAEGCAWYRLADDPRAGETGPHALTVRELVETGAAAPARVAGVWAFRYVVP